jgi:hypothetical protein
MKSEGLHEGKSRTINLGADARKKSSREINVDRLLLKTISVAEGAVICFMACLHKKSGDKPHLLPTRSGTTHATFGTQPD